MVFSKVGQKSRAFKPCALQPCSPQSGQVLGNPIIRRAALVLLCYTMDLLIIFRKSTLPQNRRLMFFISNGKQLFDEFVGGVIF